MPAKRLPVPVTFIAVVSAVIFLIIFFGAWAVSADADGQDRKLTFGFAGGATATSANVSSSDEPGNRSLDQEDAGDSWWGGAFLKACPFH